MDMFSLKGKTAVITGGGRGIGRGITRAMAKAGANVVIPGRGAGPLAEADEEARSLGAKTLVVQSDITKAADIARIVKEATDRFGYIDCWVNNAGSADPRPALQLRDVARSGAREAALHRGVRQELQKLIAQFGGPCHCALLP